MFRPAATSVLSMIAIAALGLAACSDDSHQAASSGADAILPASGDGNASAFNGGAAQGAAASAPAPASGQPPLAPPEIHYPPVDDDAAAGAANPSAGEPPPGGPGNPGTPAPPPGVASAAAAEGVSAPTDIPPSRLPEPGRNASATRG